MSDRYQAVMFDLDGTLLDTLADIAVAGNHAMTSVGRPTHPVHAYRHLAGQGTPCLIQQALGPGHEHLAPQALVAFRSYQLQHGLDRTQPYPGIPELLDELTRRGLRLAVLSNKPQQATLQAVRLRLSRWSFDAVQGHDLDADAPTLKPDPTQALAIASRLNVPPDRWLYLGDTKVDMLTARAAGFFAVGCLWGFRDENELTNAGARALIAHPTQLMELAIW